MTALEEEAVKALTGESKMDLNFINSLIAKSSANLEKALAETERIRTEIENDAKAVFKIFCKRTNCDAQKIPGA